MSQKNNKSTCTNGRKRKKEKRRRPKKKWLDVIKNQVVGKSGVVGKEEHIFNLDEN